MYCDHARLCVCPRPHAHTIARTRMSWDVQKVDRRCGWGSGRGCPLVVHYWADLQSVHVLVTCQPTCRAWENCLPSDTGLCQPSGSKLILTARDPILNRIRSVVSLMAVCAWLAVVESGVSVCLTVVPYSSVACWWWLTVVCVCGRYLSSHSLHHINWQTSRQFAHSSFVVVSSILSTQNVRISFSPENFLFAICYCPSVCCLSVVCNVRAPYSGGWNFPQYLYGIWYPSHPLTSTENFTEIVPGEPLRRGS